MSAQIELLKCQLSPSLRKLIVIMWALNSSFCATVQSSKETVTLHDNLGKHRYPVTTSVPAAQRYFDQGLILSFGFNHAEAARSFQEAYRLDPNCALCYWGEALVLGPNINAPMDPSLEPQADALVQQALVHANSIQDKEKALIWALSKRYAKTAITNRQPYDEAYADSMRVVAQRYSDDALINALYAEALMDLHPWNFWSKQGKARPWTAEIISTLEHALALDSNNPLANHLYIHVMEASPYAEKALPSAERLATLVPGSGHLVHMPAHIYIRVGRYRDAITANQQAVKIDHGYLNHPHTESIYTLAYVPHNHHFLWAAAIKTGRKQLATEAAADTAAQVKPEMMRTPGFSGTLQHFYTIPLYTQALFGEWEAILKQPAPAQDLVYPLGIWHYARGLALLRTGYIKQAKKELLQLKKTISDPAIADLTIFDLNDVPQILQIAVEILSGEIAVQNKNFTQAVTHLQKAVELEDALNYTEPKDWYLPPRQVLGAVYLTAGKPKQAEQVYREDLVYHPQNGWSLFGLAQSLREQGKIEQAELIQQQFEQVWDAADVNLSGSRF